MKKVLILVIGCQLKPWDVMIQTSLDTWDSIEVDGVDTIFYCGKPVKPNTDKIIYFPIKETYMNMGHKMLKAFEWVLNNKDFDYIARINSSCYVDKKLLIDYVQSLPEKECFNCIEVDSHGLNEKWAWGGGQYIISKDVIQKIVDNKGLWNHRFMEDVSLSLLINKLNIPYNAGKCGAIDKMSEGWRCISYGGDSITFTDFADLKSLKHHFIRVKQDFNRDMDKFIMNELLKVL